MRKITKDDVTRWIPIRDRDTYKNQLGRVLCVGGNGEMGGAILLSAMGALNAGAGLVTVSSAPENKSALHTRLPEVMFANMYDQEALAEKITANDVILLGPGLGRDQESKAVFEFVLENVESHQWLVIDADGLYFYAQFSSNQSLNTTNVVLTPHLGEWERITSIEAPADQIAMNQKMVSQLDSMVVLKKSRTEVYVDDEVWVNTAGNPAMATGGMGDTLAGIIAGFIGQFEDKKQAVLSAVYIHSAVADELAETHYVTLPSKVSEFLPIFMKNLIDFQ